jgi:hypothetical protein
MYGQRVISSELYRLFSVVGARYRCHDRDLLLLTPAVLGGVFIDVTWSGGVLYRLYGQRL